MLKSKTKIEPGKSTTPSVSVSPEEWGCATSFLTQKRNEIGKVCGPIERDPEVEYAQPDEEKESGGEA